LGRGKDPRQFAFMSFGGAGPIHGARIARTLGCPRIVFPTGAGVHIRCRPPDGRPPLRPGATLIAE